MTDRVDPGRTSLEPASGAGARGARPLLDWGASIACRETLAGLAAASIALVGYFWTLHPGLADGDSAEFQYVGRLLLPAHSPGYPLYVGLLCVWSYVVPFGSLALRANLLSAVCAAAATAIVFRLARRLGCPVCLAVLSALGMAFGRVYWSQALVAEVYAFGALLLAGALLATLNLSGAASVRSAVLVGGLLALELAHQPAVVFLVAPVIGTYILLAKGRAGWKGLVTVTAVSLLGLLPYGFVLARSGSLARGVSVATASSFRDYFLPFSLEGLLTQRLPLIGRIIAAEMGPLGLLACAVGIVAVARAGWKEAALLVGVAASLFAFAASYNVPDVAVFTIPVFVVLWPVAGIGFSVGLRARWRWARWAIALLAAATPSWQLLRHYQAVNRSADVRDTRYFAALMQVLPPNAAVAPMEFPLDQMLSYAVQGTRADVWLIYPSAIQWSVISGRPTFVLTKTATPPAGMETAYVPVFGESLEEVLDRRRSGEIVVFCGRVRGLDHPHWLRVLRALGVESLPLPRDSLAIVGELGAQGALVSVGPRAELVVERGAVVGSGRSPMPKRLSVVSDDTGTRVEVAGLLVGKAREGLLLVRMRGDGIAKAFGVSDDLRVATGYRLLRVVR